MLSVSVGATTVQLTCQQLGDLVGWSSGTWFRPPGKGLICAPVD